ncbi:MAG: glycine/betaine/sarcosine/D-proline family reductase selenoprotein B [Deltaproteobacteria bacterium]|nr:glycine/betaine/sarcosine/D-proline family reductase selenoprotein B [Deltaproteobacteria bacterium]
MKVLHYLNQFFAGIGGEDQAGHGVEFLPRAVGVGAEIEKALHGHEIEFATVACGDNYYHEAEADALRAIGAAIDEFHPDIFIAGPAFNAGRYGIACAKVCSWVRDNWRIPAITAMHEDNPGTREIGRYVFVIQTGASTASMAETLKRVSLLLEKLIARDESAAANFRAEYCLAIARRFTVRSDRPDYVRAVDLLLAKLDHRPYESEIPWVESERHAIPNLRGGLKNATIALVTEGGLVPQGNPDRLESSRGSKYFKYSLDGRDDLKQGEFQAMHTGYDTSTVDQDPDRIVPLDAMRVLEKAQRFKKLHDHYFVTTGTGAMPTKMAELGAGIADELSNSGINAVLLTAT